MAFGNLFSATDISASGLMAERIRMEVAANNIANAHSTNSVGGGAYRRQQVHFAAVMNEVSTFGSSGGQGVPGGLHFGGVAVAGVRPDQSPLPRIFNPHHPDAGKDGFVEMSNVVLPTEMVDLMTASRAYEANLKSLQTFRKMAEQALTLMRPNV